MKGFDLGAAILVIIGGLNWGLLGFFQYDLVASIFGGMSAVISRFIYGLVGLSALYSAIRLFGWKALHASYCEGMHKPVEKGV